jgi:hypothetical protein
MLTASGNDTPIDPRDDSENREQQFPVSRPVGVAILAVMSVLTASLMFGFGVYWVLTFETSVMNRELPWMGFLMTVGFSAMYLACGIGLWRLRSWAWWLVVVISVIIGFRGFPMTTVFAAPIVIYLLLPGTRRAFFAANPWNGQPTAEQKGD